MAIQFFNTASRSLELFTPLDSQGKQVRMYCCGPTVYDFAHIGNFRTFVFQDILRRHLEMRGYQVLHVMNITDVEDKIIRKTQEQKESITDLTRRFESAFLEDLTTLACKKPSVTPRATEHISEILDLIQRLEKKGVAYQTSDGSVYFSIEKFPNYGRLSQLDRDQLKPGARVSADEHVRESYGDFALWKAYSEKDGNVFWESPWGRGRPGWHIECSCMSMKHLGETLDIHCGGEDLVFPHHEDEIAQSEAATGKPFVRYWLHAAHLLVNGQKMSKSAGNFFKLKDLLDKGYSGREIRYGLFSAHYRLPLNFTLEGLSAARQALQRLDAWEKRLKEIAQNEPIPSLDGSLSTAFLSSMDRDLNISEALGHLFEHLRSSNRSMDERSLSPSSAQSLLNDWKTIQEVLGLSPVQEKAIPEDILQLARKRDTARKAKDWKRSDELRDALLAAGWKVKDSPTGFQLHPL